MSLKNQLGLQIDITEKAIEVAVNIAFEGTDVHRRALANNVLKKEFEVIKNYNKNISQITEKHSQTSSTLKPTFGRSFRFVDLGTQFARQSTVTFISGWKNYLQQLLFYIGNLLILASIFDHSMVLPSGCSTKNILPVTSWVLDDNLTSEDITNSCDQTPLSEKFLTTENITYLAFGRIFQAFPLMINSIAAFGALARVFRSEHRNSEY